MISSDLFLAASLIFHMAWVALIWSGVGRPVGWLVGIIVPYVGFPVALAYIARFWSSGRLVHRLAGSLYAISGILVLTGVIQFSSSPQPSTPVVDSQLAFVPESIPEEQSPEMMAMIAQMEAEMERQTLATNLDLMTGKSTSFPSGIWARIAGNSLYELIQVEWSESLITATRITDDSRVPKGETTWKINTQTGRVDLRVAQPGFADPQWIQAAITQFSTNRISMLPLYEGDTHRPVGDPNYLELAYIPNPAPPVTPQE